MDGPLGAAGSLTNPDATGDRRYPAAVDLTRLGVGHVNGHDGGVELFLGQKSQRQH
jgi:hypothetical protein